MGRFRPRIKRLKNDAEQAIAADRAIRGGQCPEGPYGSSHFSTGPAAEFVVSKTEGNI
jgi:hypothetical protein